MLYVAPLCPAGHLPHRAGDWPAAVVSPIAEVGDWGNNQGERNLSPCGGDVRQDRGGREGAPAFATWLAVFVALATFFLSNSAFAHAALVSSIPADGTTVATAPRQVVLTFNEPISPLVLKLVRPDGSVEPLDKVAPGDASLAIEMPAMGEGTHILSWRIVSADGHPVGGSLLFSVGAPSASGQPSLAVTAEWPVATALWLDKVVLYIGLFVGIGGVFFLSWIGPATGRVRNVVAAALGLGLLASPLLVVVQGLDALELPLSAVTNRSAWSAGLGTSFGDTAAIAAIAMLVASAAMAVGSRAIAQPLGAAALAGVGLALAASGHAANAEPHWLTKPAVFLHTASLALWAGALMPLASLLLCGGPQATASLRRFSQLIPLPVGVLVITGAILALIQVETVSALVSTRYGYVLLAKLALVAVLVGLAAYNRWRLTQNTLDGDVGAARAMARAIRIELILVAAILSVVALWRFTPPPRVIAVEAAMPAAAHLHGEKAMADLSITPGRAGEVAVSVFVMTPAFEPLHAKEVTVRLRGAGIEPFKRKLVQVDGAWRADGVAIPMAGHWIVGLDILVSDFEMVKLEGEVRIRP